MYRHFTTKSVKGFVVFDDDGNTICFGQPMFSSLKSKQDFFPQFTKCFSSTIIYIFMQKEKTENIFFSGAFS